MTPEQLDMLSIKSTIEHIVSTYIALYDETTMKDKTTQLLEELVKANKIKQYNISIQWNKKIDIWFDTPQEHGCTLTILFKTIRGNKFVTYDQFTTADHSLVNKIINTDNGDFNTVNTITTVIHAQATEIETRAIQDIAIWQTAFHSDKTVHVFVPFDIEINEYANQILFKCRNLIVNKQSLDNVITFPNNSKIIINSLCSRTSLTKINELVLLDLCGDWAINYCTIMYDEMLCHLKDVLKETKQYNQNQLLIAVCNNWNVFDTITQHVHNKQSMRVAFSDTGAALYCHMENTDD